MLPHDTIELIPLIILAALTIVALTVCAHSAYVRRDTMFVIAFSSTVVLEVAAVVVAIWMMLEFSQ